MITPNYLPIKFVKQDGNLTPEWDRILSIVFQNLQSFFSDEGYTIPRVTKDAFDKLNNDDSLNKLLIYDDSANGNPPKLMINLDGTFKQITTS